MSSLEGIIAAHSVTSKSRCRCGITLSDRISWSVHLADQIEDALRFSRVEIIDQRKDIPAPRRSVVIDHTRDASEAGLSIQDDGRTLKVFLFEPDEATK
ncbi:MAG: hypothetical protein LLG14_20365 [Nocardiaceae bacterium]|nr:hypothetical protein [Nocardiaceae bacterium]